MGSVHLIAEKVQRFNHGVVFMGTNDDDVRGITPQDTYRLSRYH